MKKTPSEHIIVKAGEGFYHLAPDFVEAIATLLDQQNTAELLYQIKSLHPSEIADLIETLDEAQRYQFLDLTKDHLDPDFFSYLDENIREDIFDYLGTPAFAKVVEQLESDDAVDVIRDLDEPDQEAVLSAVSAQERALLKEGLSYPEDSAGQIMQRELVSIPQFWSVGQVIDFLRHEKDGPEDFYDLFVVNAKHHPIGTLSAGRVMRSERDVPVASIMNDKVKRIPATMDQEEVAFLFRKYGLVSAPVINKAGSLIGVITVDDIVDVIDEEAEDDLLKLGGVEESSLYDAILGTTKSRFRWLFVNLITAILASIVIGFFQPALEKFVALAVLMPIVASMGGNAGTQSLTVAVRALATKSLMSSNTNRFINREVIVGFLNGCLFALTIGFVAFLWFNSIPIGIIIAVAMIVNMVVAGFAGATIPILLQKLGVDPAIASSVILTTVTDVIGFFAFLGLATLFLL